MENFTTFKTPKNILARMQVAHLGKILFNLQFPALAIMLASVLSFLITPLYYGMLAAISGLTLFTIYIYYPNFSSFWSGGETLWKITLFIGKSWKYTVPILLVLSISSIICLCFDKNKKHIARIVSSAIFAVSAVVILIFNLLIYQGGA